MYKKATLILFYCFTVNSLIAQNSDGQVYKRDSVLQTAHASYNKVSGIHRCFMAKIIVRTGRWRSNCPCYTCQPGTAA